MTSAAPQPRRALSATDQSPRPAPGQERFWMAARYDATQFVTYFEPVHFGTLPTRDNQLAQPRTPDFFGPRPIAPADLERVRPAAGDRPFCGSTLYAGLRLRAVIDMGYGRTGLVVVLQASGGRAVKLVEYRDGLTLEEMRVWQTIGVGD